jgi:hypothetical protein
MIVDANLLLYATDSTSPHHERASSWLTAAMNGTSQVGLPWQTIGAFVRITTHPRVAANPLTGEQAWGLVQSWLKAPVAWIPPATARTAQAYAELLADGDITGNLVPDAQLAALALEYGVPVYSADSDFARFRRITWINPLMD